MRTSSIILLILIVAATANAQQDDYVLTVTPPKRDLSVYKQMMDTFDGSALNEYWEFYPDDEDLFLYRMIYFAHFDSPELLDGLFYNLTHQNGDNARDNIYRNILVRFILSGLERQPEDSCHFSERLSSMYLHGDYLTADSALYIRHLKRQAFYEFEYIGIEYKLKLFNKHPFQWWLDKFIKNGHVPKELPPLPTTTKLDSLKIKIIDNIDIKTYNDYVANYPEDKDRLILTLYMMYATRCELSYKVMCDYISAKYGYRNPELVSRVISELTMQKERLGPYYLELLQDEYLCEDTAKHAQVNKYIFQRMAFEFTDDFFREYMFQTDEVKQQFIWEVSHPMAEGYDIQACLNNIENSTVLSENEKHRLMKALNK